MKNAVLAAAFAALGDAPNRRTELKFVADVVRDDDEARALVERSGEDGVLDQIAEVAEENGSNYYVALDLCVAVCHGVEALTRSGPMNAGTAY